MRPTVPAIAPFVDSFWLYDEPLRPGMERVLPNGAMQLLVNLAADELGTYGPHRVTVVGGAALQGAHGGPVVIDTAHQRTIAGVSFRPGGAYPFFAAPPSATGGTLVRLDDLWGRHGAVLRDRLLTARADARAWTLTARASAPTTRTDARRGGPTPDNAWAATRAAPRHGGPTPTDASTQAARAVLRTLEAVLVERAARPLVPDPALAAAVSGLGRGATVTAVTDRLGVGRRAFTSRFTDRIGLTPKRFAMVRRFQRVLDTISDPEVDDLDWATIAVEHGYYDQPHLINDFRELAGVSPTGYRPRSAADRNHVPISPIAAADRGEIMAS